MTREAKRVIEQMIRPTYWYRETELVEIYEQSENMS